MKNLLASVMFVFLMLSANLMASINENELKEYIEDKLNNLNYQLDDLSLDQKSHDYAFLIGEKEAYEYIVNYIVNYEINNEIIIAHLKHKINSIEDQYPLCDDKNPLRAYKSGLNEGYMDIIKLIILL